MTKPQPKSKVTDLNGLTLLIESVKADNLTQYGEIKKEFGGVVKSLDDHNKRIGNLERDKIERDAIVRYQREHPEIGQKAISDGQKEYNDNSNTVTINKELLNALKYLGLVVAALAAAIIALKVKP